MPEASAVFAAGLVVTQVLIAQPDWPNEKPAVADWADGQEVELSWRPVRGLSTEFECEDECYARMFGHVSFQLEGCDDGGKKTQDRVMLAAGLYVNGRREWWSVVNLLRRQHYDDRPFATARLLDAGDHRVEVRTYYALMNDDSCVPFHKRSEQSELIVEVLEP
jgi:hypothetical protein